MILPIPTYNVVVDGPNRPAVAIKVAAHNYPHFLAWTPQHLVSGCAGTLDD